MRFTYRLLAAVAATAPALAHAQPDTGTTPLTPPAVDDAKVREIVDREIARILTERAAKEAADKAAKAASMFSFWTFMALLMGAVAATVGGIFGGSQRDEVLGMAR